MRSSIVRGHGRFLARGAAVLLVCGSAAGCSSTVTRFSDGLDGMFTASTSKEATALPASAQPYPGTAASPLPAPASPIARSPITRGNLAPASSASAAAAPAVQAAPTEANSKVPLPSEPPSERVASLPQPKIKEIAAKPKAEAAASVKPRSAGENIYTVESGDTIGKVAKKTGISVAELKAANTIGEGGLKIGQKLNLPKAGAKPDAAKPVAFAKAAAPKLDLAPAAAKTEPQPVAYTPPQPAKQVLAEAEKQSAAEAPDASGAGKMRWPVRGRVVAKYGAKGAQASDGIDIAVPEGTPVKAAENGVVIYAGDGLKEFGNTVLVRHEDGLVTVYGHASQLKVTRGEKVTRGQDIALSGMSGTTDTPKLHFEVRKNSAPVDPSTFLQ